MLCRFSSGCAAMIVVIVLTIGPVRAAPQMLAVAEFRSPQLLVCENGSCAVELSAMCLQKNRRFPGSQSTYRPHNPDSIQLVFTDRQDAEQRLVADRYATIHSKRTFTAVTVRIPEETLDRLGASDAAILVAADTTLIPDPVPHDPFPLTAAEIAGIAGPMRLLAAGWLSGDGRETTTARLINKMLNGFAGGRPGDTLWHTATGLDDRPAHPGARQAKAILDTCVARQAGNSSGTVRRCLETHHDSIMYHMNKEYWNAAGTGS